MTVVIEEESSALTPGSSCAMRDEKGKADSNAFVDGAGTIVEVTKCQQREDTEWVSAFCLFQCEVLQTSFGCW